MTYNNQTFVPDGKEPLPDGAIIDVSNGRGLELTDRNGNSMVLYGAKDGVPSKFVVNYVGGLIELVLIGGNFSQSSRSLHASDATKKPVRRLWGKGTGNFRTRGRLASATVRGTWWVTAEFRAYTLIFRQGSVTVRDLVKRKTVIVRAGGSYKAFKKKR